MNILFLHSNNFYSINFLNNCNDMLYDLYNELHNSGHTVRILTVNDTTHRTKPDVYSYESFKIIPKRLKYSFQNEILLLNNIIILNGFEIYALPTEKYDIIHCFDLESSICAKLLKDRFNAKLVFNFIDNFYDEKPGYQRGAKEKFRRFLTSWFLQFVDINIVHTQFNYQRLQNIYLIDNKMIRKVPYFNYENEEQITSTQKNGVKFLLLTTFDYETEILNTLEIISLLKKEIDDIHLDLVTNPDISVFGKLLSKSIRKNKIASNINWAGSFNLKVREFLSKSKAILLFPFQMHNMESVLFEALSLNLKIIYYPSVQNEEILHNYDSAYSFDFQYYTDTKLNKLIKDLKKQQLHKSILPNAKSNYITTNIKDYEKIYEEVIKYHRFI